MAWVDANTKLYFPAVINADKIAGGYNGGVSSMVVHYKRAGVEYTDTYDSIGHQGEKGEWLCFIPNKPRVQYDLTAGRNGWGRRTTSGSGWEEGLDELVYITFPKNPESAHQFTIFIELGAYWENEVSVPTTITYNEVDTELTDGQTATLKCANKKAVSDIVVAFGSAGTITYNGTGTSVESGKTATLQCNGKKMETDVVIAI